MKGNYKITVVGMGIVGKLEYDILKDKFDPDFHDKFKESKINGETYASPENDVIKKSLLNKIKYDLAIIAVPTPLKEDNSELDCSIVEEAINSVKAEVYLIKSTLNVGFSQYLKDKTGKRIVHSPEYSGATQHCTNFEYNYTILGGDKKDCQYVQQIYQEVFDARHVFEFVDNSTSELIKLTENSWLATKVSFFNSIWEICQEKGIPYEEVRKCVVLDPRINPAHTFVYDKHPYWDSHCFNKDVPALANTFNNSILKEIVRYNNEMKDRYK